MLGLAVLAVAGCGSSSDEGGGDGYRTLEHGGVRVEAPDTLADQGAKAPEVLLAARDGVPPEEPRLTVSSDTAIGTFAQVVAEDVGVNTLRLPDYRVVAEPAAVDVPGAEEARQAEYTFTGGRRGEARRFTTHVWVRYAKRADGRIFALSVVVPEAATIRMDVPRVLRSFRLTR
jgi:hypothetical protein